MEHNKLAVFDDDDDDYTQPRKNFVWGLKITLPIDEGFPPPQTPWPTNSFSPSPRKPSLGVEKTQVE